MIKMAKATGVHWVGGHPEFTQYDVRQDPKLQHLDRVLLHIGCDDHVSVGDAGMINVLISQRDLQERRFGAAYIAADCY